MRRLLVFAVLTLIVLTRCSSDDGGEGASATTTVEPAATSSSTPATSVPADCPQTPRFDDASPTPSQGAALDDGLYFGYITLLDAEDLSLRFDVAQLLTGDAAVKAAAEDGGEANNDYWIRNASKATRTLKLTEDTVLCMAPPPDIVNNRNVTLVQLNQQLGDGEPVAVWLDVRDGVVERIQQQYFP